MSLPRSLGYRSSGSEGSSGRGRLRRSRQPPSASGRTRRRRGRQSTEWASTEITGRRRSRSFSAGPGRSAPGRQALLPAWAEHSRRPRAPAAAGRGGRPCPGGSRRLMVVPWVECNGQHPPIAGFDGPAGSAPVDWEGCTASVIPGGWPIQRSNARSTGATGASPEPEEYFSRGCPFDTFRPAQCRHCGAR